MLWKAFRETYTRVTGSIGSLGEEIRGRWPDQNRRGGEQVLIMSSAGILVYLGHLEYVTICHIRREMHWFQLGEAGLGQHSWGGGGRGCTIEQTHQGILRLWRDK